MHIVLKKKFPNFQELLATLSSSFNPILITSSLRKKIVSIFYSVAKQKKRTFINRKVLTNSCKISEACKSFIYKMVIVPICHSAVDYIYLFFKIDLIVWSICFLGVTLIHTALVTFYIIFMHSTIFLNFSIFIGSFEILL